MRAIKTILAPTDFSEQADAAVAYAADLARKFDARLILLYVFDLPLIVGTYDEDLHVPGGVDPGKFESMGDAAAGKLEALADRYEARGIDVEPRVVEGGPAPEIVKAARALEADLLVMGTHGRRGLDRWILGSVAASVVRSAPCPVLTVPRAADERVLGEVSRA